MKPAWYLFLLIHLSFYSLANYTTPTLLEDSLKNSFSFGVGSSHYFGDLAPIDGKYFFNSLKSNIRWNIAIGYEKRISNLLSIEGNFSVLRLYGDDYSYSENAHFLSKNYNYYLFFIRNLHFKNTIPNVSLGTKLFLSPNRHKLLKPFFKVGIGVLYSSPKAKTPVEFINGEFKNYWIELNTIRTSNFYYKPIVPFIPTSIGFETQTKKRLQFGFEIGYNYIFSDYIDDVAYNRYPNPKVLNEQFGELSTQMSFRGYEDMSASTYQLRTIKLKQIEEWLGKDIESIYNSTNATRGFQGTKFTKWDSYLNSTLKIIYKF